MDKVTPDMKDIMDPKGFKVFCRIITDEYEKLYNRAREMEEELSRLRSGSEGNGKRRRKSLKS